MITLTMTEGQAKICSQACEFFARIRMGQFQEIVWLCGKNHCAEDYDEAQQAWLDLRKQVYPDLDGPGHSYGVGHFPEADTAYDIHQVIDYAMDGKEPWSLNPLPECYIKQNPKPLTIEELREMHGEPVWIVDICAWGIVSVDDSGQLEGRPFVNGVHTPFGDVKFSWDVEARKLVCYRNKPGEGNT